MRTQHGRFSATCSAGSTLPRILIMIGSFLNRGPSEMGVHPTHREWEGQTYDHPRHHLIGVMCDNIEATVADLQAKGAEFRGAIEQREYGRVVMMAVPGADDIQLYEPSHKLAYNL